MACYQSLGGVSGFVVMCLALIIEAWLAFIEWWQPQDEIDQVPDLVIGNEKAGICPMYS